VSFAGGIELGGEDGGEAAEDVEVVPLNHGADGGSKDDSPDAVFGGAANRDLRLLDWPYVLL